MTVLADMRHIINSHKIITSRQETNITLNSLQIQIPAEF